MPKYMDLAAEIKDRILRGELADGDKLETETELMRHHNIGRQTVRHAVSILESEGYVTRRQGSGTFVHARQAAPGGEQTVGLVCTSISDYIFPTIIGGIEAVLTQNGYTLSLAATQNQADLESTICLLYTSEAETVRHPIREISIRR